MRNLEANRTLANAKRLAGEVFDLVRALPVDQRYTLTSQIQRAAVSIAANIAEGLGRGSLGDLERFLKFSAGSAAELAVLLELCADIYGLADPDVDDRLDHVRRQLHLLVRSVRTDRGSVNS